MPFLAQHLLLSLIFLLASVFLLISSSDLILDKTISLSKSYSFTAPSVLTPLLPILNCSTSFCITIRSCSLNFSLFAIFFHPLFLTFLFLNLVIREFLSLPRKILPPRFILFRGNSGFLTLTSMLPLSNHLSSLPLPISYFQPSPHLSISLFPFRSFLLISYSSLSSYDFSPLISLYKLSPLLIAIFSPALLPISISLLHDLLLSLPNSSTSGFSLSFSLSLSQFFLL